MSIQTHNFARSNEINNQASNRPTKTLVVLFFRSKFLPVTRITFEQFSWFFIILLILDQNCRKLNLHRICWITCLLRRSESQVYIINVLFPV